MIWHNYYNNKTGFKNLQIINKQLHFIKIDTYEIMYF